jgi:crotonobetainyl-CoA:carnitine CoA-transferase CaiB-like acyl-CoA transferase
MPTTLEACTVCGTEFHARAHAAYCSAACRQRAYRHRHAEGRSDVSVPATIGCLISAMEMITSELEKHTADMNYPGTDEFNAHTFPRHPFDDSAYEVLHDLTERIEAVSNDLYSAEEERQSYAALTPRQQKARTQELEEIAEDAQASAGREAEWERGAKVREIAWAALPPERN